MSDQPVEQPDVAAGSAVLNFHVGDARQVSAVAVPLRLRTPTARGSVLEPAAPDPEPEPRRSAREPSVPEKPAAR